MAFPQAPGGAQPQTSQQSFQALANKFDALTIAGSVLNLPFLFHCLFIHSAPPFCKWPSSDSLNSVVPTALHIQSLSVQNLAVSTELVC